MVTDLSSRLLLSYAATALIALALASCSNPRNAVITSNNADKVVATIGSKLGDNDRKLLVEAAARSALGNYVLEGKTVGQVLNDQQRFDEQESAKQAAEHEEQLRIERQRATQIAKLNSALVVYPVVKEFRESNYDVEAGDVHEAAIIVTFKFRNKTNKRIGAFKGIATFQNSFGDVIESTNLDYEDHPIPAAATITWVGDHHYNQFEDRDQKLRDTPLSQMRFKWQPQGITFTDGSQILAPTATPNK